MRLLPPHRLGGMVGPVLLCAATLLTRPSGTVAAQGKDHTVSAASLSPELQQTRALLEKYQDPVVSVHDGYFSSVACVEYQKGCNGGCNGG